MSHEFFKSQIGVGHENFENILGGYLRISSAKKIRGGPHKISLLIIKFL